MAVQNSFFGRREPAESLASRLSGASASASISNTVSPVTALSSMASADSVASVASADSANALTAAAAASPSAQAESSGSKLTVGPNIKLKGVEITDCDTLVVEGTVEATMDSRVMQIAQQGAFRGAAEIDIAEIHGEFNGTLTVREKLVIFATGKVTGKIRYGKLVVEEGGQLSGDIEVGTGANKGAAAASARVFAGSDSAASAA